MQVKMNPPIRNEFDRVRIETKYLSRLLQLFGSVNNIQHHDNLHQQSVDIKFVAYCATARAEALHGENFLPSERQSIQFVHNY